MAGKPVEIRADLGRVLLALALLAGLAAFSDTRPAAAAPPVVAARS